LQQGCSNDRFDVQRFCSGLYATPQRPEYGSRKAASWAAARKVNETDLLNMRLSPDMFNLARQVRAATDHALNAAARLSGKEPLKFANDETTIPN
jgi:hypothetical protein